MSRRDLGDFVISGGLVGRRKGGGRHDKHQEIILSFLYKNFLFVFARPLSSHLFYMDMCVCVLYVCPCIPCVSVLSTVRFV